MRLRRPEVGGELGEVMAVRVEGTREGSPWGHDRRADVVRRVLDIGALVPLPHVQPPLGDLVRKRESPSLDREPSPQVNAPVIVDANERPISWQAERCVLDRAGAKKGRDETNETWSPIVFLAAFANDRFSDALEFELLQVSMDTRSQLRRNTPTGGRATSRYLTSFWVQNAREACRCPPAGRYRAPAA